MALLRRASAKPMQSPGRDSAGEKPGLPPSWQRADYTALSGVLSYVLGSRRRKSYLFVGSGAANSVSSKSRPAMWSEHFVGNLSDSSVEKMCQNKGIVQDRDSTASRRIPV